jgi:hypothetical protein
MQKRIKVTQEDIDKADGSHNAHGCPFAVALKRAFPGRNVEVSVIATDAIIFRFEPGETVSSMREHWDFSTRATKAIDRYDSADTLNEIEPGTYVITRQEDS